MPHSKPNATEHSPARTPLLRIRIHLSSHGSYTPHFSGYPPICRYAKLSPTLHRYTLRQRLRPAVPLAGKLDYGYPRADTLADEVVKLPQTLMHMGQPGPGRKPDQHDVRPPLTFESCIACASLPLPRDEDVRFHLFCECASRV
jgi:hypothetical protein